MSGLTWIEPIDFPEENTLIDRRSRLKLQAASLPELRAQLVQSLGLGDDGENTEICVWDEEFEEFVATSNKPFAEIPSVTRVQLVPAATAVAMPEPEAVNMAAPGAPGCFCFLPKFARAGPRLFLETAGVYPGTYAQGSGPL